MLERRTEKRRRVAPESKPQIRQRRLIIVALGTLLLGVMATAFALAVMRSSGDSGEPDPIDAAQQLVMARVVDGSDVEFAPVKWTKVENLGDERFRVSGWLTITNPKGKRQGFDYTCLIAFGSDSMWHAEKVDLVPH